MCTTIIPVLTAVLLFGLGSTQEVPTFIDSNSALVYAVERLLLTANEPRPLAYTYRGSSSNRRQLDVTNAQAAACKSVAKETVKVIAHPNTCAGYVFCNYEYLNNIAIFRRQVVLAEPQACPFGTFYVDGRCQAESPTSPCTKNPCAPENRGKRFTDGYACNSYIWCKQDADVLEHGLCNDVPDRNERFDVGTGACVVDDTCDNVSLYNETVVSCTTASGPLEAVGVSYYNKTVRDANDQSGRLVSLYLQCPSGLIFQEKSCSCIDKPGNCPFPLISLTSQENANGETWINYRWRLEELDTLVLSQDGWAQFNGNNYLKSAALADNELAASFELSFLFRLMVLNNNSLRDTDGPNLQPGQTIALMGNSQDSPNCRTPTLEVYLNAERRIVALAKGVDGNQQTLTSDPIQSFRQQISVTFRRETDGNLVLRVQTSAGTDTKTAQLGNGRLAATKCGLIMGAAFNRNSFVGLLDNVSLTRQCTAEEQAKASG